MIHKAALRTFRLTVLAGGSAVLLAACETPLDLDMRGGFGDGFSTADAATSALSNRPQPDNRGVISYPNYQVAVARRGDTLTDVANRVGTDVASLARYNGIDPTVPLRKDEIIALPTRVAEPSPATGASGTGPITTAAVDIQSMAGNAINRAPQTPGVQTSSLPAAQPATQPNPQKQTGREPIRHRVERGETAFTIARLYSVPVATLAEWNGLGADFSIRDGQYLLIPVPQQAAPARTAPVPQTATLPGAGSPTPTPPSAAKPLPPVDTTPTPAASAPAPAATKPVADVGKTTKPTSTGRMIAPVQGSIIRAYSKGKNEGINIKGTPGAAVKAADSGTVAAITKSADGIPIVVIRHPDNLLTVYANVSNVSVAKGDSVSKGASIAKLRAGDDAFVHFEVRNGFDSVDPTPYLN
ncbi:LysM peptidoglycan-binding domain-containing protein [Sulfitobacter sp.]|uniref:LysM peptidoglycan-binding domain-containing protein n=1 Tax=Sulfitobacter sp. TaxID=1903071 RepID=UPI003F6D2849